MTPHTPRSARRIKSPAIPVACTLLALLTSAAIAQDQLWIRQHGVPGDDGISALAPDATGGVFVAGYRFESLANTRLDAYLARYDEKGRRSWYRQISTDSSVRVNALATIASEGTVGVLAAGRVLGPYGGATWRSVEAFLSHYDERGSLLWFTLIATSGWVEAFGVSTIPSGGAFVTGYTSGILAGQTTGSGDVFLIKVDSAGNILWAQQYGSPEPDNAYGVAPDGQGGAFVAGFTHGNMGWVNGNTGWINAGETDAFLARFDKDGNILWVHQMGSIKRDVAYAVESDGAGGAFVAGWTEAGFNGNTTESAFVIRVDADGNRLWTRQFGSYGREIARALTPDGEGGVIVAGELQTDFVTPGTVPQHAFAARYDKDGNQLWLRRLSSGTSDTAFAVAADTRPGHPLAFTFAGTTRGDLGGPNAGQEDAFIARFGDRDCFIADCDQSSGPGVLDIFDFLCFQLAFTLNDPYACDCDTSTGPLVCDVFDFLCFQAAFVRGCPW